MVLFITPSYIKFVYDIISVTTKSEFYNFLNIQLIIKFIKKRFF